METIVALILGLGIGAAIGVLVMLAFRGRPEVGDAGLKAKLDAANDSLADERRISAEHKQAADEQRALAQEGSIEITKLQTEFEAYKNRFDEVERDRDTSKAAAEKWQNDANDGKRQIVKLQTDISAANNSIAEFQQSTDALKAELTELRAQTALADAQNVRLEANLNAANKRIADFEQSDGTLRAELADIREQAETANTKNAELQANLNAANKRLSEQTDIESTLLTQFKNMASETLSSSNEEFLKAADEKIGALMLQAKTDFTHSKDAVQDLVKPLSDELKRIESARAESQGSLSQQLDTLVQHNNTLASETRNLTNALKRPEVRGSWGEMQLRRVVELAGMTDYCDYQEQVSITTDDGRRERPDMVVRMPNERTIVVDAKAPMDAYLTAIEADTQETREAAIKRHAQQVKDRADGLAKKSYQRLFERSPDFVVMFLPGEYLLSAALENDRELIDRAMQQNVIIATPNTLMALLKAVAMGWREVQIEEEAAKVAQLGQELYDRIRVFAGHMVNMRNSLNSTVENFNSGVGSLESRVLVSARRFKDMDISISRDISELGEVNVMPRELRAAELRALPQPGAAGDD